MQHFWHQRLGVQAVGIRRLTVNNVSGHYFHHFVKTPTTTSIQLNTTTIDVGFDMIMTVHTTHPTTPPHQELYISTTGAPGQCKLTQS